MSNDQLIKDRAISIQAGVRVLLSCVADVLYKDPHQWGNRGCGTCRTVSSILGEPFGCDRFRINSQK